MGYATTPAMKALQLNKGILEAIDFLTEMKSEKRGNDQFSENNDMNDDLYDEIGEVQGDSFLRQGPSSSKKAVVTTTDFTIDQE